MFLLNAISFLAIVGGPGVVATARREMELPVETFSGAMRAGLRYAMHSPNLRGVLNRTALFCLPGAALQALLPIVARNRLGLSSGGYGVLLGCFGIGAASAAVVRPRLDERFDHDQLAVRLVDRSGRCSGARGHEPSRRGSSAWQCSSVASPGRPL